MTHSRASLPLLYAALLLGCGSAAAAATGQTTPDAGSPATSDAGSHPTTDAGTHATADAKHSPPGDATADALTAKTSAIQATITGNSFCSGLSEFYWEIGDKSGPLVSGAVGSTYDASSEMSIASASKLVFGAYVLERFKADISQVDASAMRMLSGYASFEYDSCLLSKTVSDCAAAGNNAVVTDADVGDFYYGGGHFQQYALTLGLGNDDNAMLATDIKAQVGTELAFTYGSPQLAAGIRTSASDYGAFLRKILSAKLAIFDHLGENPVCTQPSTCPTAVYSPAPAAWHYSYAHWIEDDPTTGDGAFSSPGAYGFYPWIDATKTYYGILARYSLTTNAYVESAECGAELREAFVTGVAQ